MNINELKEFNLADAIKFHKELNPKLWKNDQLDPLVRKQLLIIAEDFVEELGIADLDVVDITISGSNAAFTWTKHSDLDLHILVNMSELHQDAVYRELFRAKKTLYNDTHDITVHGIPVELYVQDSAEPVVSLGEYSILHDKWIKVPKRRSANLDQNAAKAKFDQLKDLIDVALKTKHSKKINKALALIRRYRQAGLDKGGEFSPENLAYKAVRSQGAMDALYAMRDKLHSAELTIEEGYAGAKMKFLKPGELRGSHTPAKLMSLGFKKSQNGSWFILQSKWDELRKTGQLYETDVVTERLRKEFEDYDPNGKPPGPEFKPTMPAGTVKVDVSDVYDWYKLGQHISNMKGLGKHDFGKGPPSTILSFGDEETEHKYIKDLEKTGLTTTDIDPVDVNQPKGMKRQKTDPTYNVGSSTEDLDEALDSQPYPYEESVDYEGNYLSTFFTDDNNEYVVKIEKGQGPWIDVVFSVTETRDDEVYRTTRITGTGDARKVFATVIDVVKKYTDKHKPKAIHFSAQEPSRIRLYDAFVKRIDRALPDYVEAKKLPNMDFWFVLKRKTEDLDESKNDTISYSDAEKLFDKHLTASHDAYDRKDQAADTAHGDFAEELATQLLKNEGAPTIQLKSVLSRSARLFDKYPIPTTWEPLDEALDSQPYPYEIVEDNSRSQTCEFMNEKNNRYIVEITKHEVGIIVEFLLDDANKPNLDMGITGTGDARKVFATVIEIIKNYTNEHKPSKIFFSSSEKEPSRVRLYQALAKRADRALPDYTFKPIPEYPNVFTLVLKSENLDEALDSQPYPYEQITSTDRRTQYVFHTDNDLLYKVTILNYPVNRIRIEFGAQNSTSGTFSDFGVTGTGDARKVFATVIEIIKKYVDEHHPTNISFTASEPSRIRLYDAFLKRLDRALPDYEGRSGPGPYTDDTYFNLKLKNQKIDEALDSQPYPYEQVENSRIQAKYTFNTDRGLTYFVGIGRGSDEKIIHISFWLHQPEQRGLNRMNMEIANTGDARKVFATVIDIVKKYVNEHKPNRIIFTASEDSRIRLYDAFVKRLDRELPGYIATPKVQGMSAWFILERKPAEDLDEATERDVAGDMLKAEWDRFKGGVKDKVSGIFKENYDIEDPDENTNWWENPRQWHPGDLSYDDLVRMTSGTTPGQTPLMTPLKVKIDEWDDQPKGTYDIKEFRKVSFGVAKLVIVDNGQQLTTGIMLDDPDTHLDRNNNRRENLEFYHGKYKIPAVEAFNLFQLQQHTASPKPPVPKIPQIATKWEPLDEDFEWQDDPMNWHGNDKDPTLYQGLLRKRVKMSLPEVYPEGHKYFIQVFYKNSPTTAVLVYTRNSSDVGRMRREIDFDAHTRGEVPEIFWWGDMTLTAEEAFNLYQLQKRNWNGKIAWKSADKQKTKWEPLDEALDSQPYPYQITSDTTTKQTSEFTTDADNRYVVGIFRYNDLPDDGSIFVDFSLENVGQYVDMGITGTGDSRKVFATVIEIIKKYVVDNKPKHIYFTAGEPSRRRLYAALVKRVDRALPNYESKPCPQQPHLFDLVLKSEKIDEALDSQPYPYEIEEDSIAWQISNFTTSDRNRYKVWLSKHSNKEVSVEFALQGDDDIDIDIENGVGIKNTGDARRVFATVIEIVKRYANKYKPNMITFSSDHKEPSRMRLYGALVKRADRLLPDYRDVSDEVVGSWDDYVLARKGYQVNEASGYIPSKKEANDPRFKTALTVDVKPDSIQKNAKAFGSKTSRAGIPPQARADGKIK